MSDAQPPRTLFNPFYNTEYRERGGYGHIFIIPGTVIAVKIAHRILNGTPPEDHRAAESLQILHQERDFYKALATREQHPNIVEYFLSTELAIFMRYEPDTVDKRLQRQGDNLIDERLQFRWVLEMARAASWLESLGYFHGDMRPENLLLDRDEHIKLCDFGRTVKQGTRIEVATYPFYRPSKDAIAGPSHEQFAIGSCVYTIRTGQMPYGEWTTPSEFQEMHDALVRGDFPATDNDHGLGPITTSCWHGRYQRIADVKDAISQVVGVDEGEYTPPSPEEHRSLVRYCQQFVHENRVGIMRTSAVG